jgi:hypothetical protein
VTNKPEFSPLVLTLGNELSRLYAGINTQTLSKQKKQRAEQEIREAIKHLQAVDIELRGITLPTSVFDPGNPRVVGRFIAIGLVAQTRHPLADLKPFFGAGVYALYYRGDFAHYGKISKSESPIYIGQAKSVSPDARTPVEQDIRLYNRLKEHRANIINAKDTLNIDDFDYRALVVQSGWESTAEEYLISLFKPIWNREMRILYGFGKHGDSAGTRANKRSPWDTLHPSRKWAGDERLSDKLTLEQISYKLESHFSENLVYESVDDIVQTFTSELNQGT